MFRFVWTIFEHKTDVIVLTKPFRMIEGEQLFQSDIRVEISIQITLAMTYSRAS